MVLVPEGDLGERVLVEISGIEESFATAEVLEGGPESEEGDLESDEGDLADEAADLPGEEPGPGSEEGEREG